jgi:hypothetical protein
VSAGGTTGVVRELFPHAVLRQLPPDAPAKIACVTLDLEHDYGVRTGQLRVARHERELEALRVFLRHERIPLSLFVVTELLDRWPEAAPLARMLGDELHSHSHTHALVDADVAGEIRATLAAFERHFGRRPAGYRAPQGRLRPEDVPLLARAGFGFSASIVPSVRPGVYDHLRTPPLPLRYENGLVELPFGVLRGLRVPLAVSYFKVLGPWLGPRLLGALGAPPVVIVNCHLHDVIVDEESLAQLTAPVRAVYQLRKHEGLAVLAGLTRRLRDDGYAFLAMSDLRELCGRATWLAVAAQR